MKIVGSINRLNEEPISRDRLTSEHLGDGTDSNWGSEVNVPDNSCTPCVVPVLVVRCQLLKSSTLHDIHPVGHLHLACSVIRIRFVNEASPGSLRWVKVSGASCRISYLPPPQKHNISKIDSRWTNGWVQIFRIQRCLFTVLEKRVLIKTFYYIKLVCYCRYKVLKYEVVGNWPLYYNIAKSLFHIFILILMIL